MILCSAWRWAGAVALCAIPTHDDETVMNGAPRFACSAVMMGDQKSWVCGCSLRELGRGD
jgi:hypothetical protein